MKREYDFSNAVQGKFYIGDKPVKITIHLDSSDAGSSFEIVHENENTYYFRLKDKQGNIVVTSTHYPTKTECMEAVELLRESALVSQTVEV